PLASRWALPPAAELALSAPVRPAGPALGGAARGRRLRPRRSRGPEGARRARAGRLRRPGRPDSPSRGFSAHLGLRLAPAGSRRTQPGLSHAGSGGGVHPRARPLRPRSLMVALSAEATARLADK